MTVQRIVRPRSARTRRARRKARALDRIGERPGDPQASARRAARRRRRSARRRGVRARSRPYSLCFTPCGRSGASALLVKTAPRPPSRNLIIGPPRRAQSPFLGSPVRGWPGRPRRRSDCGWRSHTRRPARRLQRSASPHAQQRGLRRLSLDLHDGPMQDLVAVGFALERLRRDVDHLPAGSHGCAFRSTASGTSSRRSKRPARTRRRPERPGSRTTLAALVADEVARFEQLDDPWSRLEMDADRDRDGLAAHRPAPRAPGSTDERPQARSCRTSQCGSTRTRASSTCR